MDSQMRKQVGRSAAAVTLAGVLGMSLFLLTTVSAQHVAGGSLPAADALSRPDSERLSPRDHLPLASTPLSQAHGEVDAAEDEAEPKPRRHKPTDRDEDTDYKAETRAIVIQNATELASGVEEALQLLASGNASELLSSIAPDENADIEDANTWMATCPTITEAIGTGTIQVFSYGDQTIYVGFASVEWTDGGIESQHTIAVPMRLVDGSWYLSTLSLTTPGLKFVQSVQL